MTGIFIQVMTGMLILIVFLIRKVYKITHVDDSKALDNRFELFKLMAEDGENDKMSKEVRRTLAHVFHPDFKNIWSYVPSEEQDSEWKLRKLDNNFWKSYKIKPDFVIPAKMVYELYKQYLSEHIDKEG